MALIARRARRRRSSATASRKHATSSSPERCCCAATKSAWTSSRSIAMLSFAAAVPPANARRARKVLALYDRTRPRRPTCSRSKATGGIEAYELYARGKSAIAEGRTQQGVAKLEQALELWTRLTYRLRAAIAANELAGRHRRPSLRANRARGAAQHAERVAAPGARAAHATMTIRSGSSRPPSGACSPSCAKERTRARSQTASTAASTRSTTTRERSSRRSAFAAAPRSSRVRAPRHPRRRQDVALNPEGTPERAPPSLPSSRSAIRGGPAAVVVGRRCRRVDCAVAAAPRTSDAVS